MADTRGDKLYASGCFCVMGVLQGGSSIMWFSTGRPILAVIFLLVTAMCLWAAYRYRVAAEKLSA